MNSPNRYSDEELIRLIADDDEKAFKILFDRYWETAYKLAGAKLKSTEVAREIVHDLFLNFWQRRHTLQIENFRHYIHGAVRYKVISYFRQQLSKDSHFLDYQEQLPVQEEATRQTVEYNDLLQAIENGMKMLPEKTQEVFRLSRFEGRTTSEIANELNLSEKAIEYHITRSRKELRLHLRDFLVLLVGMGPLL